MVLTDNEKEIEDPYEEEAPTTDEENGEREDEPDEIEDAEEFTSTLLTEKKFDYVEILQQARSASNKKTTNYITKYEYTSLRGKRLQQLASGCAPFVYVDMTKIKSIEDIFNEEFKQRRLPFIICREMPNNDTEYWQIKDLSDLSDYQSGGTKVSL